jgi:hypothetical protein
MFRWIESVKISLGFVSSVFLFLASNEEWFKFAFYHDSVFFKATEGCFPRLLSNFDI